MFELLISPLKSPPRIATVGTYINCWLARRSEKDELVPYLAAEIPTVANGGIAADNMSVTWKLKPGLKWSDGSAFTPDDIIFTWQYCADEKTACTTKANFDSIALSRCVLDHHDRISTARNHSSGRDRRRPPGLHLNCGQVTASNDLSRKEEPPRRFIACTNGIACAHRETIYTGTVERRHIDRRKRVHSKHAPERVCQRNCLRGKRRQIEMPRKAQARFVSRHDLEKDFLP